MTTIDFPQTSTKETKLTAITMFITKTEQKFEYNKSHQNYGLANQQLGFLNGLIEGRNHLTIKHFLDIEDTIVWAETQMNICLGNHDYGKCDYWHNYISALGICNVIIGEGE